MEIVISEFGYGYVRARETWHVFIWQYSHNLNNDNSPTVIDGM